MSVMTPVSASHPLMTAWEDYKNSDDFKVAHIWALEPEHLPGSLWHMFETGWRMAAERAAELHEQADSASDAERLRDIPGAGAMGAVVEYRDRIRKTLLVR